jgi:hypothetical protein
LTWFPAATFTYLPRIFLKTAVPGSGKFCRAPALLLSSLRHNGTMATTSASTVITAENTVAIDDQRARVVSERAPVTSHAPF